MIQLLALAALGSAAALTPPDPAQASDTTTTAPKNDMDKKVCRREAATGSIMPKLVCHTKGEWLAMREQGEKTADKMRDRQRTIQPGDL